tara:strand:+ start:92 stop:505 length:414 start_codon:yes stop_codon:yes gene_type:complete
MKLKILLLLTLFIFGCSQNITLNQIEKYNTSIINQDTTSTKERIKKYYENIDYIPINFDEQKGQFIFRSKYFSIEGSDIRTYIKSIVSIKKLNNNQSKLTLFIFQSEVMPPNKNINDKDILIYDELVYKSFFSEIQR